MYKQESNLSFTSKIAQTETEKLKLLLRVLEQTGYVIKKLTISIQINKTESLK